MSFYFYTRYKINYWTRRGFPQLPEANLIFGHVKDAVLFRTAPGWHLGHLYQLAQVETRFVGFYIFHKPCLLLRDPQLIRQILISDFENFSDRHFGGTAQMDSTGMNNLLGLKNPAWKYVRMQMARALSREKLKMMLPLMDSTCRPMMNHIRSQTLDPDGRRTIDVQDMCFRYTTDLIANVGLGTEVNSFENPDGEFTRAMMKYFHGLKRMISQFVVFFVPELIQAIGPRVLLSSEFLRQIFWTTINHREKVGGSRGDFIDSLIQLKNQPRDSVFKFEGKNLLDQIGLCLSGFETSATAAAFTLLELARSSHWQDRVRQEVRQVVQKHGWTFEALSHMKILDQCLFEAVRLHPPVATLDRYTRKDYRIPGSDLVIERGTPIFISLYGLHGDGRFFDCPEIFRPERFNSNLKYPEAYFSFGQGPRMCIGVKTGQQYVKLVITLILMDYEISECAGDTNALDTRSTLTSAANGIKLNFKHLL